MPVLRDEFSLQEFSSILESTEVPLPCERKPDETIPSIYDNSASALRIESQQKVRPFDGCQEAPLPCNPRMLV